MARVNFILKVLQEKGEATFKPHGNSMTPLVHSGDQVRIKAVGTHVFRVGDIVYAKVKGNYYLHLLTAIDSSTAADYLTRFQISNNHGHVNGWCLAKSMFGICVQVKDKIIVSDQELTSRNQISLSP